MTLPGRGVDLGLRADTVLSVSSAGAAHGAPLDLESALGWTAVDGDGLERVLTVKAKDTMVSVKARGKLGLCAATRDQVLPLPRWVLNGTAARALEGVLLRDAFPPLLLVSSDALSSLWSPPLTKKETT